MSFWENASKVAKATGKFLNEKQEEAERRLRSKVRTLTDDQVMRAMTNAESEFARSIAYDEAERRRLI